MFMCGVYGDPAAGKHTTAIYEYFRDLNPNITLGMNSNGGIRNTEWWTHLGSLFHRDQDYVVFSIDGLEDTNHIYRRGVDWHKMIENIQAFISTGANAHWDMLVYHHNEHQIDICERLAKKIGFKWFRIKVSRRILPVGFYHPTGWVQPRMQTGKIVCQALEEHSAYIDAKGRMLPCCWLGSKAQTQSIDFQDIQKSWQSDQPEADCVRTCSQRENSKNNFEQQWKKEVNLDV